MGRVFGDGKVAGNASITKNCNVNGGGGVISNGTHEWCTVWANCDGYSKCIVEIDGVAWIGAGCRWFTLEEAMKHWTWHSEDRLDTVALLEGAKAIASLKGLKF